ncbi:TIGR01212 family radical SAM protein [Facklamia sp. DSM 111018]|uniref:TIGR01212 family radical SAM protein n=1 Tax=Facklamia lactis TaxID=2749967 RepID=A0ABS0LRA9_9LACT|nr:TIGR01212 family radical SAM protein [Facklamia lactis]MBG9980715.1 TIGR01212 family radical SAM protein [Facklamia lactis]MBG9986529.1 TIGR01212 family radical SAM protein [Facklamia lactis]
MLLWKKGGGNVSGEDKRYNSWNKHLKEHFGEKVFKVSLDGGFTCPNRDGTVATGGCTFCSESGSGDFAQSRLDPLPIQLGKGIKQMHKKWPRVQKYIAYFQNFTNTHAPVEVLRRRFEQVLYHEGIVGIMIATRPDCLPLETVEYLAELNQRYYMWVELGLQTIYDQTSQHINRGHDYDCYLEGVAKLRKHHIPVCTHLINGLPGETTDMMLTSVRRVVQDSDIQGLKLHLLYLMEGTKMVEDYESGLLTLMEQEEYIQVICDQLEYIPKHIIIHRLTGDAPRERLIGPQWSLNKWEILNAIDDELVRRNSYQGISAP